MNTNHEPRKSNENNTVVSHPQVNNHEYNVAALGAGGANSNTALFFTEILNNSTAVNNKGGDGTGSALAVPSIRSCPSIGTDVSFQSVGTFQSWGTQRVGNLGVRRTEKQDDEHMVPSGATTTARSGIRHKQGGTTIPEYTYNPSTFLESGKTGGITGPVTDYLYADEDEINQTKTSGENLVPNTSNCASSERGASTSCEPFGTDEDWAAKDARPILPKIAFFMGDLRDGLPMINMQTTFLMTAKHYAEKQVGMLFFVFGLSLFLTMPLSGYLLDYTNNKIQWVQWAAVATSAATVFTATFAEDYGANLGLMALAKVVQGCASTLIPLGLHSITLGIVGSTGMTVQVARNKVANHLGTALIVAFGTLAAFLLYSHSNKLGFLFLVSPLWCMATIYYLWRIKPSQVDRDAARALVIESPTMTEYEELDANNSGEHSDDDDDDDSGNRGVGACGLGTPRRQERYTPHFPAAPTTTNGMPRVGQASDNGYHPPSLLNGDAMPSQLYPPKLDSNSTHTATLNAINELSAEDEAIPQPQTESLCPTSSNPIQRRLMQRGPSFIFGIEMPSSTLPKLDSNYGEKLKAKTPFIVLSNPTLLTFTVIVFLFHLGNSAVLPLVMQTLAVEDARMGILTSGLCIFIAQSFMSIFAKICGDYSPIWGRKILFLIGLFSLPVRCACLFYLSQLRFTMQNESLLYVVQCLILSTQLLDAMGAGIFGTLYVLVTNDIAAETGRFNLMIGVTSGAMCLGGTVSGYVGQALAQDYGYHAAFAFMGVIGLLPAFMYLFWMPETLPEYLKRKPKKRRRRLRDLFLRRRKQVEGDARLDESSPASSPTCKKPQEPEKWAELV